MKRAIAFLLVAGTAAGVAALWARSGAVESERARGEYTGLKHRAGEQEAGPPAGEHDQHAGHGAEKRLPKLPLVRMSFDERVADQAAAARELGPERPLSEFGELAKDHEGRDVLQISTSLGGGTYYGNNLHGNRRVVPYALAPFETAFQKRSALEGMHTGMYDHAEHHACAQMHVNNAYERGEPDLTEKIDFNLILRISGDGSRQTIDDVQGLWPDVLDEDVRTCYSAAFGGLQWPSQEVGRYYMQWPVCINPPAQAANDNQATGSGGGAL